MARLGERAGLRALLVALAVPVVVAVPAATLALAESDELDGVAAAAYVVPVIAFGAVIARAWVLVLPLLLGATLVAAQRIADLITGDCSICTSDENWGNYPMFFFAIAVVPLTVAVGIGILLGRLARR
jgi:hypothetical protein